MTSPLRITTRFTTFVVPMQHEPIYANAPKEEVTWRRGHKSWPRNVSYIAVANCDKSRVSMDSQTATANCRDQSWRQSVASPASRSRSTRNAGHDLI